MKLTKKIAIILPYFGKLLEYTNLYFKSCELNPEVDFLVFSDQEKPQNLPENVFFNYFTINDFKILASRQLEVKVKINNPYKICDYKPTYGHVFQDYLKDYDWWGYTDLDMVLGIINRFISDELFESNDIVTARNKSFAGNFTLFSNTQENRFLYRNIINWKEILRNKNAVYCIDEVFKPRGIPAGNNLFSKINFRWNSAKLVTTGRDDLNSVVTAIPDLKVHYGDFLLSDQYFKSRGIENWQVEWKDGKLIEKYTNKEGLYFHFYRMKDLLKKSIPKHESLVQLSKLLITKNSVFLSDQEEKL